MAETTKVKFRVPYRDRGNTPGLSFEGKKSLTQRMFKDDCDINAIISSYTKGVPITHVQNIQAQYGDVTNVPDLQEAMHILAQADELFKQVPAKIRKEFDHDPKKYFDFVTDENNVDAMIEMGLIPDRKPAKGKVGGAGGVPPADAGDAT